ncbi:MAG TPA: diguanylate cyclase [Thermoanaerobaculia bacterium]|nr:diguanylate cyclase [Thermoanaerobaculia bacterium]
MIESPLVIAVVDDDPAIRRLLEAIARGSGDVVVEAATFAEGQIVLREYPWDVAVIDRSLPDGDGLELCREVAAGLHDSDSHRHIVFLSASAGSEEKLRGFEAGADEYIAKPADPTELRARLRAIRRTVLTQKAMLARLATLEQLSVIDGLTHVYNRHFFDSELRRLFDLAKRHERPLALAMIDLDLFKSVNDTCGHRVGDAVLNEVSTAIAQSIRSSDVLARYGGEEFVLVLPETTLAEAAVLAERVRAGVEGVRIEGTFGEVRITISIGVAAMAFPDTETPAGLVEAADKALYLAKEQGRNCVRLHGMPVAAKTAPTAP